MANDVITVYPLVKYRSEKMAKNAFLDAYFGDGAFEREDSAKMAGIEAGVALKWFLDIKFFGEIEKRLQVGVRKRSSMQETLLEEAHNIMDGNITDVFDQTPEGYLVVKNIKTMPREVTACIKQMDLVRTSVPGRSRAEYTECLRIVMHDKTKVMNILGDWTDVKNNALKSVDTGAPKMVGLTITTAMPERIEHGGEESGECGEVHDECTAEGEAT